MADDISNPLFAQLTADPQPPVQSQFNPLLQALVNQAGVQSAPRLPNPADQIGFFASQAPAQGSSLLQDMLSDARGAYQGLTDPRNWAQAAINLEYQQRAAMTPGTDMSNTERLLTLTSPVLPGLPGAALAAPEGTYLGVFGGRLARTADHAALDQAQTMAAAGSSNEAIRGETGWFLGPDQKWRFEIPDQGSTMKPVQYGTLGDVLDHPDLYAAYPELRDMRIISRMPAGLAEESGGLKGFYSADADTLGINPDFPVDSQHRTALHEIQHAVQNIEGFSPGGSVQTPLVQDISQTGIENQLLHNQRLLNAINKHRADYVDAAEAAGADRMDAGYQYWRENPDIERKWRQINGRLFDLQQPEALEAALQRNYARLAGEVEARDVSARLDMTPQELRDFPPYSSQFLSSREYLFPEGKPSEPALDLTGYHGSPQDGLTQLQPSTRGPLGAGAYLSPYQQVAERYAGPEGHMYEGQISGDIFHGGGSRFLDPDVNPYEVWRQQTQRLIEAAEPEMRDRVAHVVGKLSHGDGYPLFAWLSQEYRDPARAQALFQRAGFDGLLGHVDGPEVAVWNPQAISLAQKYAVPLATGGLLSQFGDDQ